MTSSSILEMHRSEWPETLMVYLGSSEAAARSAFTKAVMNNPHAASAEILRDFQLHVRVLIERP